MEIYCTRPGCPRPANAFSDLDDRPKLKASRQKFCMTCGMPLMLQERYVPLKLLGRGGFGAAFLARDRYTPAMRQCVVKQFQPAGHLTPDQLKIAQNLFEREGEVLENLGTHVQIPDLMAFFELDVPSRTAGQADRFFYLVQEFIDGQNLEEMLAQRSFSETEVMQLLLEILPVLQFVHDRGSIHRDIKPSNIMRRRDGLYYLLDFGAVKQVTSVAAVGGQGHASTGIYSMGFAPPEQIRGDRVYPATDLYALAVTCIMLLTGKAPADLYDNYSDQWNWRGYAQVSDRLEAVLNRMLRATPSQRFPSAEEVIAALRTSPPPAASASTALQPPPAPPLAPVQSVQPGPPAAPARPPVPASAPPPVRARSRAAFSLAELIGGSAFTGFEGSLLAIALTSLIGFPVGLIAAAAALCAVILAQYFRWIEKIDLLIIGAVSLAIVVFLSPLHAILAGAGLGAQQVLLAVLPLGVLGGLGAVTIALIFRLIYTTLARWL